MTYLNLIDQKADIMLCDLSDFRGFKIIALNDQIGTVHDFYFSPDDWKAQYIMCDAGYKMTDRIIIFCREAIERIEFENRKVFLNLNKEKIFNSPFIGSDDVVTKPFRKLLHEYYGWSKNWETEKFKKKESTRNKSGRKRTDVKFIDGLNCTREIINQVILADHKELGLVKNLLMDVSNWKIVYMLISQFDTESGIKLIIKPDWITKFKAEKQKIQLVKSSDSVLAGPRVNGPEGIDEAVEAKLREVN